MGNAPIESQGENVKRLHIVGCPRSGTTLLMELITTCFKSDGFCEHEMSIFEPLPQDLEAGLYVTKQPNDIKQLNHIFEHDKNLFVIYSGRDPRAVISSKHRESPNQYFCNYRVWSDCDRAAQRFQGHPRFMALRYEDLVEDADAVQRNIVNRFSFLQTRHLFSEYSAFAQPSSASQRAMNGVREVNSDSLNKWHDHLPRIAQQYRQHPALAEDLRRLGYEANDSWTEILEGVEPRIHPCRYPDKEPRLKEWEKSLRVYFKSRRYLKNRQ